MRVAFSHYSLTPHAPLNVVSQALPRIGALFRVEFAEGQVGYADCHPWSELGDLPLQEQLNQLREGQLTPLTASSLKLARVDAEARSGNQSVWEGLQIPPSHYLMTNWNQVGAESL